MSIETGRREHRVVEVDGTQLHRVLSRPPLWQYILLLWERRFFIMADARARVEVSNTRNLLGRAWLIIDPLLNAGVYFIVFGLLLHSGRGIPNFLGYLLIGVFFFAFTNRCLTQGATSITSGKTLIRAFMFPRASLPVATVVRETLSFVPVLVPLFVLLFAMPWIQSIVTPGEETWPVVSWLWLFLPFVLGLQWLLSLGLALVAARLCARIPDLTKLIGVFSRFWLYSSAVFFSPDRFENIPWMTTVMQLNPMFLVLDITRDCVLYGVPPDPNNWFILEAWAFGLAAVGLIFFWRGEETYGAA